MGVVAAIMTLLACASPAGPQRSANPPSVMPSSGTGTVQVGGRPVTVHVPGSYDSAGPVPLVVALHAYTSDPAELESYLRLTGESDRRRFVYAYPQGSTNAQGELFWNATDACCAFSGAEPDDSGYLSDLIAALQDAYRIDRARVYLIGHSNGAFMAFRMACDHADQVTAIVAINGASWNDPARCAPSQPVGVLAVHSTDDENIAFGGGVIGQTPYPSAQTTLTQWLGYNRCAGEAHDAAALDLVNDLPGAETSVRVYDRACAAGSTVQAWTINGGSHVPHLGSGFAPAVTDFLLAHTRRARSPGIPIAS